MGIIREDFQEI